MRLDPSPEVEYLRARFPELRNQPDHIIVSALEHMNVLRDVMTIFVERNAHHDDAWRVDGWQDHLHQIRHKTIRLLKRFRDRTPTDNFSELDDAFDLINYVVFFIRQFKSMKRYGDDL